MSSHSIHAGFLAAPEEWCVDGIRQRRVVARRIDHGAYHRGVMAIDKIMLSEFRWDPRYTRRSIDDVLTPASGDLSGNRASNIERTLQLLGGNADRWRVHIKTAKLGYTLRMLVERGVRNFKCATTLELLVACQSGAADVLSLIPLMGANARRVREIAEQFPERAHFRSGRERRTGAAMARQPGGNFSRHQSRA